MSQSGVALVGLAELTSKLEALDDDESHKAAMSRIVLQIERDAKKNAPVDTGNLKGSIESEVRIEGGGAGGLEIAGFVGSNVKYAPFVELGTRFMEGQAFLRRAVQQNRRNIEAEFDAEFSEVR